VVGVEVIRGRVAGEEGGGGGCVGLAVSGGARLSLSLAGNVVLVMFPIDSPCNWCRR
jgi:hypothetical protein